MSERYVQLKVYDAMYTGERAPVIIAAAALLKDTTNDAVLAQLKFKNISNKTVVALTASVIPYGIEGNLLTEKVEHLYLDLHEGRDSVFGQKTPIHLSDNSTRQMAVFVSKIVFEDNTTWEAESMEAWTPLPKPEVLSEHFNDDELVKQYSLEYGDDSVVFPLQTGDLWYCKCGAINYQDEDKCHTCEAEKGKLFGFDMSDLTQKKDERLQKEAEQRAEAEEKAAAEKEKLIKKLKIIIPCVVAVVATLIIIFGVVQPRIEKGKRYDRAVGLLKEEKYEDAVELFNTTRDFKDTEKLLKQAEKGAEEKELYDEVMNAHMMPIGEAIEKLESIERLSDEDQKKLARWKDLQKCEGVFVGTSMVNNSQKKKFDYSNSYPLKLGFSITNGEAHDTECDPEIVIKDGDKGYDYMMSFDNETIYFSEDKALDISGYMEYYYQKKGS